MVLLEGWLRALESELAVFWSILQSVISGLMEHLQLEVLVGAEHSEAASMTATSEKMIEIPDLDPRVGISQTSLDESGKLSNLKSNFEFEIESD